MRCLPIPILPILAILAVPPLALAQDDGAGLAQIKERELEAVREKISALKDSMDRRAKERDRITSDLQDAEASIAEKRASLKDLERERDYSVKRQADGESSTPRSRSARPSST